MKKLVYSLLLAGLLPVFNFAEAQIIDKIKRKAEQKKNQKENEAVDKIFKGAEDATKKDSDKKPAGGDTTQTKGNKKITGSGPAGSEKKEIELWSVRYDFVPGKKILFYDDFENEEIGEIPAKWKFLGGGMETVKTSDGAKVMKWWDRETRPNFKTDFVLPDEFTVEFEIYFEGPPCTGYGYTLNFYHKGRGSTIFQIEIDYGSLKVPGLSSEEVVPGAKKEDFYNTWHHISISYNKGSMKGYFDQYRLFNVRVEKEQRADYIAFYNCCTSKDNGHIFLIDNVRIAEGAHAKYKEEILEGGKIVTNNIHFAHNSSPILPRSYAEIKRISDIMKENPGMNFSIEGHTDNDGSDEYNAKLSKERADAVKKALSDMGIAESRLSTKGFGETVPVEENTTPEGKAMNRRVEFRKV